MPIYEYECSKCGERFLLSRNFEDKDEDIKCPKCETSKPRRMISEIYQGECDGGEHIWYSC